LCIPDAFPEIHLAGAHRCQMNCFHTSAKGINHLTFLSFDMFDFEMKLAKEGHPPILSSIEFWLVKQVPQSTMVCHKYKFPTHELMPPHFQSVRYGGQL
jgi:hypothetical protein